jgi:hypothetical protein
MGSKDTFSICGIQSSISDEWDKLLGPSKASFSEKDQLIFCGRRRLPSHNIPAL